MSSTPTSSFRPLQTINEERSTHGLRYGDYTRYRKHCAHKTHRLRSALKLTHGKGREFKKLPQITAESAGDGHLHLLLFETERAWAHAQELSAPQDSRRSTSRYRRSHTYLARLLTIVRSPALASPLSAQSSVELLIYALIHTARLNLRRPSASTAVNYGLGHHKDAADDAGSALSHPLIQLSIAYMLLDQLENSARTSKEVALARAFKDEIGPEIRWCIHEFGRGEEEYDKEDAELEKYAIKWKTREWDVEGIVGDIAPAYSERVVKGCSELVQRLKMSDDVGERSVGKKQILEELVWDGEPVPVRNPELVDALLKVQESLGKLKIDASNEETDTTLVKAKGGRGKISKYDGVLLSLSDAADQARKIVEAQQLSGATSNTAPGTGTRDIHFMHAYLTYLHLTYRIERDLLLLSALASQSQETGRRSARQPKNTASTLHLLSGILQSLTQAMTLPITDESPDLSTALAARLSHTKAQRTLHLARAYAHPLHKKYAEALLLTQHGHLHIREARSTLTILPPSSSSSPHLQFYPFDAASLDQLAVEIGTEEERFKIEWFTHNGGSTTALPPAEKHKKPLFFDIAFNYVEPPIDKLRARAGMAPREDTSTAGVPSSGKAKAEEEEVPEPAEEISAPRRGLTGLLGSWWGRK